MKGQMKNRTRRYLKQNKPKDLSAIEKLRKEGWELYDCVSKADIGMTLFQTSIDIFYEDHNVSFENFADPIEFYDYLKDLRSCLLKMEKWDGRWKKE